MESTEQNRVWHDGPPPHVGWWNASALGYEDLWRWWNGKHWSLPAREGYRAEGVLECANSWTPTPCIRWNDYWPADARVPRLAPEDFEVGARWVCVKPRIDGDAVGLELRVHRHTESFVTLATDDAFRAFPSSFLPNEHYVPRRCLDQNRCWISVLPEAPSHG